METHLVHCTKCRGSLSPALYNNPDFPHCPYCSTPVRAEVFPALFKAQDGVQRGEAVVDNEASCFYHPPKKAVVPCAMCGRFLCSLCDIEFSGQHLCSSCIETGKKKGKIKRLETNRTLYDNIALSLAIIPLLIFWITIVTAPASLYISIRHWRSPSSIIPRTKVRFVFAIFLAGLQIAGWVFFFTNIL